MKFKVLISALLLSMALPAAADVTVVEKAYEVALSELRLPRNEAGTIAFKECEYCDYVTKRVTAHTQYRLNGKSISLAKFRTALERVQKRDEEAVTVLHHVESNKVTVVSVNL